MKKPRMKLTRQQIENRRIQKSMQWKGAIGEMRGMAEIKYEPWELQYQRERDHVAAQEELKARRRAALVNFDPTKHGLLLEPWRQHIQLQEALSLRHERVCELEGCDRCTESSRSGLRKRAMVALLAKNFEYDPKRTGLVSRPHFCKALGERALAWQL